MSSCSFAGSCSHSTFQRPLSWMFILFSLQKERAVQAQLLAEVGGSSFGFSRAFRCLASLLRPSGFDRTTFTPTAEASLSPKSSAYRVNKRIGTFGIACLRMLAASAPFKRGIAKSSRIKSGLSLAARSIASTPSAASRTSSAVFSTGRSSAPLVDLYSSSSRQTSRYRLGS